MSFSCVAGISAPIHDDNFEGGVLLEQGSQSVRAASCSASKFFPFTNTSLPGKLLFGILSAHLSCSLFPPRWRFAGTGSHPRRSRSEVSGGSTGGKSGPLGSGLGLFFGEGFRGAGAVSGTGHVSGADLTSGRPISRAYASRASLMTKPTTPTPTTITVPTTISGAARTQTPRAAAPVEATAHRPVVS